MHGNFIIDILYNTGIIVLFSCVLIGGGIYAYTGSIKKSIMSIIAFVSAILLSLWAVISF